MKRYFPVISLTFNNISFFITQIGIYLFIFRRFPLSSSQEKSTFASRIQKHEIMTFKNSNAYEKK